MDKINVIWKSYHKPEVIDRGYWDNGLLEDIFKQFEVEHHYDFDWLDAKEDEYLLKKGAVVIINGRTHVEDTKAINEDIAKLRWVLFIDTGDEESSFPWREIKHPIMRVWIMLPRMNVHDDVSYHLPNGYRNETHDLLKGIGFQEKPVDWFFSGQVNHPRREQCVNELKYLRDSGENANGVLFTGDTFGAELLPYNEYLRQMAGTKIVLCPSGVESPDSFRLYEALEAGCLPIVDSFSTNFQTPGFWKYLFGGDTPFPIIGYWDALPKLLPELLKGYPENANRCYAWWQLKKREIKFKLLDDVKELSR